MGLFKKKKKEQKIGVLSAKKILTCYGLPTDENVETIHKLDEEVRAIFYSDVDESNYCHTENSYLIGIWQEKKGKQHLTVYNDYVLASELNFFDRKYSNTINTFSILGPEILNDVTGIDVFFYRNDGSIYRLCLAPVNKDPFHVEIVTHMKEIYSPMLNKPISLNLDNKGYFKSSYDVEVDLECTEVIKDIKKRKRLWACISKLK